MPPAPLPVVWRRVNSAAAIATHLVVFLGTATVLFGYTMAVSQSGVLSNSVVRQWLLPACAVLLFATRAAAFVCVLATGPETALSALVLGTWAAVSATSSGYTLPAPWHQVPDSAVAYTLLAVAVARMYRRTTLHQQGTSVCAAVGGILNPRRRTATGPPPRHQGGPCSACANVYTPSSNPSIGLYDADVAWCLTVRTALGVGAVTALLHAVAIGGTIALGPSEHSARLWNALVEQVVAWVYGSAATLCASLLTAPRPR